MKNYIVIGSNSFSGSSFIDYLLSQNCLVHGISRSDELDPVFLKYKSNENISNYKFNQMDLNHDLNDICDLINDYKDATVVNFASQSMVAQSWEHPLHWYQTNTLSTIALHDELRKMSNLKRYVHISTPEVYGSCTGSVRETHPYNPSTPYATSRAAADMSLMNFYNNYNFPVLFTRAANVYGEHQQLYRIIPRTILYILTGQKLQLHGGGHSERSFIHIDDVAKATYQIAEQGQLGTVYHISTKKLISIRRLVETICDLLDADFNDIVDIVDDRPGKDASYSLSTEKIEKELDWQSEIDLEAGIKSTINWVQEELDTLKQQAQKYIHKA